MRRHQSHGSVTDRVEFLGERLDMKTDALLGTKLKIERAEHHIIDLQARLSTFFATDPNLVVKTIEPDGQSGFNLLKVTLTRPLPREIPSIIGDAISNLRASLDHLIYDLALKAGGRPPERTHFPFAGSKQEFEGAGTQRKIELLGADAKQMIADLKPYREDGNHLLWALNRVRNSDLHRKIVAAGFAVARGNASVKIAPNLGLNTVEAPKLVHLGEQTEVVMLRFTGTAIESDYQIAFNVVFRDTEIVNEQPVVSTLHQFAGLTRGIVARFEKRLFNE